MNRIRSGDTVIIIAGKNKGQIGKVSKVIYKKLSKKAHGKAMKTADREVRVIVEGANFVKKTVKPNPKLNQQGGIVTREASIHISNVAMYNSVTKKAGKVGIKSLEKDGKTYKVRYFKENDEVIDPV